MLAPADASGMSTRSLFGLILAFSLTQLPVDELKLKLLAIGALQRWGELAASYDLEVQQIALGALTALLDGEASAAAFDENPIHYRQLVTMLPPLLHSSSALLYNADVHRDVLRLGRMLTAHPSCALSHDDVWLWERLLEYALPGLELDAAGEVDWAGIAAAASAQGGAAELMLLNAPIQRWLLHLAEEPPSDVTLGGEWLLGGANPEGARLELPGGGSWPAEGAAAEHLGASDGGRRLAMSRDELDEEREDASRLLARQALHRLAQASEAQDDAELGEEELERNKPLFSEYLHYDADAARAPLPAAVLNATPPEEALLEALVSLTACLLGGVIWGGLRGVSAAARARRPVWRSMLASAAGACAFEGAMQLKLQLQVWARSPPETPVGAAPPHHKTLVGFAGWTAVELVLSSQLLWLLIQPQRAPFAFGGWLAGRLGCLASDLIEIEIDISDV